VLHELLGLDDAAVDALAARGIVRCDTCAGAATPAA
jgi:hypothetical protein